MRWKTLDDMDLDGKAVLVRVDINVPVEGGEVTDATRIERIKPTIDDVLAKGGKPVLLAHFGRPKGKPVPEMSLRHIQPALERVLGRDGHIHRATDREAVDAAPADAVILVENTRFSPMEEANAPRWRSFSPRSGMSMSTTPSRPPTGHMPPPRGWRGCCPRRRDG